MEAVLAKMCQFLLKRTNFDQQNTSCFDLLIMSNSLLAARREKIPPVLIFVKPHTGEFWGSISAFVNLGRSFLVLI